MQSKRLLFILVLILIAGQFSSAQLLKKLKDRAEQEIINEVFGDNTREEEAKYEQTSSSSGISNTRGGGLTHSPPNVIKNIGGAETAFTQGSYTEARYAVRQAILGIEMEIGQRVLDGLPASVKGLNMVPDEDKVASMSIGFVGLTIERVYSGSDLQLKITIGNDAALLSSVNIYMSSSAYASTDDQNHKQVKFKEYRGVLAYDDFSGYTLSVPFGQSSVFIAGGINFNSEEEIMSAAREFDIEKIKQELGEQ